MGTGCDADTCPKLDTCPYPNESSDQWPQDRPHNTYHHLLRWYIVIGTSLSHVFPRHYLRSLSVLAGIFPLPLDHDSAVYSLHQEFNR